jgi:hypothetical protein
MLHTFPHTPSIYQTLLCLWSCFPNLFVLIVGFSAQSVLHASLFYPMLVHTTIRAPPKVKKKKKNPLLSPKQNPTRSTHFYTLCILQNLVYSSGQMNLLYLTDSELHVHHCNQGFHYYFWIPKWITWLTKKMQGYIINIHSSFTALFQLSLG